MARGPRWTEAEDLQLREVVKRNRRFGPLSPVLADLFGSPTSQLEHLARKLGRTYAAVRKRVSRLQLLTYGHKTPRHCHKRTSDDRLKGPRRSRL